MIATIIEFIKKNWIISLIAIFGIFFILFPRQLRRMFASPRRRRRKKVPVKRYTRRRVYKTKSGKPLPRSVGTRRSSGKGYPAAGGGYIPFKYNKDGTVKKAWQVGGTVAAKSRMSKLRRSK